MTDAADYEESCHRLASELKEARADNERLWALLGALVSAVEAQRAFLKEPAPDEGLPTAADVRGILKEPAP